jgi:hypothetical protein
MFGFGKKKKQEAEDISPDAVLAQPKKAGLFERLRQGLFKTGNTITRARTDSLCLFSWLQIRALSRFQSPRSLHD